MNESSSNLVAPSFMRLHAPSFTAVIVLVILDQWTKYLAVTKLIGQKVVVIIPKLFDFSLVYNTGAAFGLGSNWPPLARKIVFLGISCLAAVLMLVLLIRLKKEGPLPTIALTLIFSGAVGNLIDRFRFSYVVDFIHVFYKNYHWPHFNIADSCISVGVGLFALYLIKSDNKPKT
jgi:signal peptidase II